MKTTTVERGLRALLAVVSASVIMLGGCSGGAGSPIDGPPGADRHVRPSGQHRFEQVAHLVGGVRVVAVGHDVVVGVDTVQHGLDDKYIFIVRRCCTDKVSRF